MALANPLNFLPDFPGWTTKFEPMFRQEQSRTAGGITYVKDLGSPLWLGAWVSRVLRPNELDHWRARLDALEGGLQAFKAYPMSRCYPIAYPNGRFPGAFAGAATVGSIGANRKSCALTGLPSGYKISIGDLIEVAGSGLHRVMEAAVASGAGATPVFEVRPHFWPGAAAPAAANLVKPSCLMRVVPGSINSDADVSTGRGTLSFQGIEAR